MRSRRATTGTAVAYSYIRFSHPDQAKGDSLRRQTAAAAEWCEQNGIRLDTSTTLHDLGKSAFTGTHRTNPDRHALAAFLKLVEAGKVPRGSYLILENLDRLSREHIQPALLLALNLLQAGVRIVQLKPAEMVFDDKSDTLPVMMMMMELSRGHGESAIKSERVGAAWAERKRRARDDGEVLTHRLPAWIEELKGRLCLISERAAVVKRIFALATAGYGHEAIVKKLTAEQMPAFGDSGRWSRSYVALILKDRRALGELQPRKRDGRADGAAIPNYFPAVITEDVWDAARAGAARRKQATGRSTKHVDVFAGLVRNAREGDNYYCATRTDGGKHQRVLINTDSAEGRAKCWSFPYTTFERAVLSLLGEIDPHEILNGDDGPDESLALAGELARVETKIAELEAELLQGDVAALANVLRRLEGQKRDLAGRLSEARQRAAHPLSEAWGEAKSLPATLDRAPDPEAARLRLRAVLRRIVDSIYLLVVPRGRDRLAAVQVWFAGGKKHRDYFVLHRPAKANASARTAGQWWVRSLAEIAAGVLDLRRREDALLLEESLSTVDLSPIEGAN
jgi:DNA invertase Pin-like site-specific DNA recombinase